MEHKSEQIVSKTELLAHKIAINIVSRVLRDCVLGEEAYTPRNIEKRILGHTDAATETILDMMHNYQEEIIEYMSDQITQSNIISVVCQQDALVTPHIKPRDLTNFLREKLRTWRNVGS